MLGAAVQTAEVSADVADIGRRINAGDPMTGWRGDPTMSLHVAVLLDRWEQPVPDSHVFEVEGIDAHGDVYVVGRWTTCDARILRDLVAGDWQNGDAARLFEQRNRAVRDKRLAKEADARAAVVDRLSHDLRRIHGFHHGGLSRLNLLGRRS